MKPEISLFIDGRKWGHISSLDKKNYAFIITNTPTNVPKLEIIVDPSSLPDEPLRSGKLSTQDFLITNSASIIHDSKIYRVTGNEKDLKDDSSRLLEIPEHLRFIAMPVTSESTFIDYVPESQLEEDFIYEGYGQYVRDCPYILVPPKNFKGFTQTCRMEDLLIQTITGTTYKSISGRLAEIPNVKYTEGRYIHLTSIPKFTGTAKDLPFIHTKDSLLNKSEVLNERLQAYGDDRLNSANIALASLPSAINRIKNRYHGAHSIYPKVVQLTDIAKYT